MTITPPPFELPEPVGTVASTPYDGMTVSWCAIVPHNTRLQTADQMLAAIAERDAWWAAQTEALRADAERLRIAMQEAVTALEAYHAYGWPDRAGVLEGCRTALAARTKEQGRARQARKGTDMNDAAAILRELVALHRKIGQPGFDPTFSARHDAAWAAAFAWADAQKAPEPMTERDQFDLARWHKRIGELADAYYETGPTHPARERARAALLYHALECSTGWRARSVLADQMAAQKAAPPAAQPEPVAEVLWHDPRLDIFPPKPGKIIDASIAWMEAAPIGTKLYAAPAPAPDGFVLVSRTITPKLRDTLLQCESGEFSLAEAWSRILDAARLAAQEQTPPPAPSAQEPTP